MASVIPGTAAAASMNGNNGSTAPERSHTPASRPRSRSRSRTRSHPRSHSRSHTRTTTTGSSAYSDAINAANFSPPPVPPVPKPFRAVVLADLLKATRDLKAALHLVAQTGEMLSQVCTGLSGCQVPPGEEPLPADLLADASFLADTVRLLSGSHKLMGDMFWRDLELPVQRHLDLVNRESLGVTTTLHTRLSHIRPLAHSAAKKAAKRFAKTSNPVTDHKLAAARDDAHSLAAEVARLEHDAATAADRIAAPHLRAVVTLTGSVARSAAVSCTNLAAATQALVLVGSIGSRTARAMAPDMAAVANANADAAASAAAGWGIGVAPMPRGPSPVYPSGRMRTISGVSNSTGGYGGRGRAVSVASTTVSVADHVASKVPLEADAGDARRDMRARIFSMLSTDIGALAGEVVARSAV